MDKTKKYYGKAMDYYCEGYIDKALEYCEKSLALARDYSPALNLKGLIHYVKGDLEEAQLTWKVNYKLNDDGISKKYLDDSKKDREILELFTNAIAYYKEIKIHQALELFKECEKSHFNVLNLWNYIADCYMKLGEYEKCIYYINEVLKIDKTNGKALTTRKNLTTIGIIKKQVSSRNLYLLGFIGLLLVVLTVVYLNKDMIKSINILDRFTNTKKNIEKKLANEDNKPKETTEEVNKPKETSDEDSKSGTNSTNNNETPKKEEPKLSQEQGSGQKENQGTFDAEGVRKALDSNNYEEMLNYLEVYNKDTLSLNEKALLVKVEEKIESSGVEHFYNLAMTEIKNNEYKKGISNLNKILKYSEGSYLNPHIIYMLGYSHEKTYDIENANKYYEDYVSKYPKGDYTEAVLYSLALINKDLDVEKSKKYAQVLAREYKESQYNNSIIKEILKK